MFRNGNILNLWAIKVHLSHKCLSLSRDHSWYALMLDLVTIDLWEDKITIPILVESELPFPGSFFCQHMRRVWCTSKVYTRKLPFNGVCLQDNVKIICEEKKNIFYVHIKIDMAFMETVLIIQIHVWKIWTITHKPNVPKEYIVSQEILISFPTPKITIVDLRHTNCSASLCNHKS